ncbi:succinate dehydrogenase, hydrophobic membrane anchor protein [Asticcacaulis sp. 201]|uniref:succinate dehydrogenase, hydrophobic membrane anchor protein n=1 Tax=Asticcacaulis sp. 201 TaxID=3028787 RepID=UPI002916881F|nr:succinate dehydrogenase, hydrophobic membrane anchor protein [Asticcacaulis sp. 201]MDV6331569.1 succinate dehydrogenase, hydrophobic membrane anchor protein [Asticcacaulis sp. 201]
MSDNRDVGARSSKDWKKSAHHGAGEWLAERGTSLALIPLTLWAAYAAYSIAGGGFDAALAFAKLPLNAGLIALTMLISVWHMYMGVKVIIDDYLAGPMRGVSIFLTFLLSAALVIATGIALWLVHQAA